MTLSQGNKESPTPNNATQWMSVKLSRFAVRPDNFGLDVAIATPWAPAGGVALLTAKQARPRPYRAGIR
jgi:hypothetical protein